MTNDEAQKHLVAKLECLMRSKGFNEKCDTYNSYEGCYECDLAYKQGNIGEQIESLKLAVKTLEEQSILDKIRAEIEDLDIFYDNDYFSNNRDAMFKCSDVLQIIDKYRAESEDKE